VSARTFARTVGGIALSTALALAAACGHRGPSGPRVIILGFDGMDYALARDLMAAGRMPNFSRVAASGGTFSRLATTIPPQSPVAWSTFMTGLDPGAHGIFDFIHRDPKTMAPYLSTTRSEPPAHTVRLGSWRLPLSAARVESLRHGTPFWEPLEAKGIETTIMRMPADFPPTGTATRELAGMGTPDILGTYGQFTFFTSAPVERRRDVGGGTVEHVDASLGVVRAALDGPDQPYRASGAKMSASFVAYIDSTRQYVRIAVGDETRLLKVGDWSDWVPVQFDVDPWQTLRAEARFFLKQLDPEFELYVSPVNLDPLAPALPISTPPGFAAELARETGRYYTQGMPEDTSALKAGVFSTAEFLRQAAETQTENLRQFRAVLGRFDRGLLFYYFGDLDQVSHMLWRERDPQHPAYDAGRDAPFAHAIDDLYVEFDGIVGETIAQLRPGDLLVVMSDHGFTSWRRSFNLNAWLRDQGYVRPSTASGPSVLGQIDLTGSRAYGFGLNGLYLNLKGREAYGVVDPARREALLSELTARLLAIVDPSTGQPAITHVYRREQVYSSSGNDSVAPDLIVGYAKGIRVSDESALGELSPAVFADNTSAWSGDHCMDPEAVPGILLTNRPLKRRADSLQTLAPAILAEMDVPFPERTP
jgi:predicted AlkP superfamily phosphohydrolase/phosphomutase